MFLPLRPRGDEGEDAGDRCEDDELRGQGAHSGKDEDDDDDDVADDDDDDGGGAHSGKDGEKMAEH